MKTAERRSLVLLLGLALFGCEPGGVATVELALSSSPPEGIETITVFVKDLERGFIVTSATVSRERTRFPLGVPAETPLEFSLIARRADPPPSSIGPMPAYVGRVRRRIPLGSERESVVIVAHPGGAVRVAVPPPLREDVDSRPRLEVQGLGDRPTRVYDLVRRSGGWRGAFALESGVTTLRLLADQGGRRYTSSARVPLRRDEETLVRLELPLETRPLPLTPRVLELRLFTPELETPLGDELDLALPPLNLALYAEDEEGLPLTESDLPDFRVKLRRFAPDAEPVELDLGSIELDTSTPVELEAPVGPERWWLSAELATEPPLRVDRFINVRPQEEEVGAPVSAFVTFEEEARLARGTWMLLSMVDERGAWVRSWTSDFDFSGSDQDVVLGEVSGRVRPADRGVRLLRIQRSSASITGETTLRGTLSSTIAGTPTALELALPVLELD